MTLCVSVNFIFLLLPLPEHKPLIYKSCMKKNTTLLFAVFLIPMSVFGQDFPTRVKEAYALTDHNYDIDCAYNRSKSYKLITPVSDTLKNPNELTRHFVVENGSREIPMTFTLSRIGRRLSYAITFDNTHTTRAKFKARSFLIPPILDEEFNKEFETNRIGCSVNFAYALPVILQDDNYHINVHPHTVYDFQNRLKEVVESYLNDTSYKSIIMLEADNLRGNKVDVDDFFDGIQPRLRANNLRSKLENVPLETTLVVSPAGNNRFQMDAQNEINVTFTGGNHNYCIWNNARNILVSLMNSKNAPKLNFHYDTNALVAQQDGMEGEGINFTTASVYRNNLLVELLSKELTQKSYHAAYLLHFREDFAKQFSSMYRTFTIHYDAPGFKESFTMNGDGIKDLEVSFNYY